MQAGSAVKPGKQRPSRQLTGSKLTELQQLYWIGHQLRPSAAYFNNAFSFRINQQIDPDRFAQAFATAVCQFDALRTIFVTHSPDCRQVVLPNPPARLEFVEFTGAEDGVAAAASWQLQRVAQPFDLAKKLYDSALLKVADDFYLWFLNFHHLITDAASFFLVANAVFTHYENMGAGQEIEPTPRPKFARYVASWQQQNASPRAEKSRQFWQEKVQNRPGPLHFYGRSRQKKSNQVKRWTHRLSPAETSRLFELAETADLGTMTSEMRQYCLMAALFFSLLHQLTEDRHLGFVTTIHNRSTQVNRQTAGLLMTLCPVTVTVEPEESFTSLMAKIAAEMKQLLRHYRFGASQAVSELGLDLMFSFVQRPSLTLCGQPVTQAIVHPGEGSERLGLHAHHLADSGGLELYLDLHQDIFSEEEMVHAQQSLRLLLDALLRHPEAEIAAFSLPWPVSAAKEANEHLANGRSPTPFTPPLTPVEGVLQQIWQSLLQRAPIGIHEDFFDLGGDSLKAMNFLSQFEEVTGRYLPLSSFLTNRTIASLASQLESPANCETAIQIQPGAADSPALFIIPGAAGNTLAINRLAQHMPPSQPIYTFQMPLLAADNLPAADVRELADYYLTAVLAVQPDGPILLAGYSAGGIFAYELAQKLLAMGKEVPLLVIIDMPAPHEYFTRWRWLSAHLAAIFRLTDARAEQLFLAGRDFLNRTIYFVRRGFWVWLGHYAQLGRRFWQTPNEQKWQQVRRWLSSASRLSPELAEQTAVPADMDPTSLTDPHARTLFNLYDRAVRQYFPQPYPGRLVLLRCPLGYGRAELRSPYPHYGWQPLAQELETHVIPANGHLALMQEPAVAQVSEQLQLALTKALR